MVHCGAKEQTSQHQILRLLPQIEPQTLSYFAGLLPSLGLVLSSQALRS